MCTPTVNRNRWVSIDVPVLTQSYFTSTPGRARQVSFVSKNEQPSRAKSVPRVLDPLDIVTACWVSWGIHKCPHSPGSRGAGTGANSGVPKLRRQDAKTPRSEMKTNHVKCQPVTGATAQLSLVFVFSIVSWWHQSTTRLVQTQEEIKRQDARTQHLTY